MIPSSAPGRTPVAVVATTVPLTMAKFHHQLLQQLRLSGYDVCVVTAPGEHLDLIASWGYRTHELPMRRNISPWADFRGLLCWLRLLNTERPRIVVTATPKASLLGQMAAYAHRVPWRLYFLGGLRLEGESGTQQRVLSLIERLTMAAASDVVANSPSLETRCLQLRLTRSDKLRRTHPASSHGVDSDHFTPCSKDYGLMSSLGLREGVPILGFVGRLTRDKGIDCLIDAARELDRRGVQAQWLIVGPQDEPDSVAYMARLQSGGGRISVTGFKEDVRPYLALLDLHVLPSRREGFPNVVLEAAAMAVPTITTTATGCVDSVVDGVTGLLVPTDDATALTEAIIHLLDDSDERLRFGIAARARVVDHFRPEEVVRSLIGVKLTVQSSVDAPEEVTHVRHRGLRRL